MIWAALQLRSAPVNKLSLLWYGRKCDFASPTQQQIWCWPAGLDSPGLRWSVPLERVLSHLVFLSDGRVPVEMSESKSLIAKA